MSLLSYILLLRIQMIFPKQQMKIENQVSCIIKNEAIQLIIELYLDRKRDEDIEFLKKNFGTTSQLANSIGSSIKNGLTPEKYYNNRLIYGQNKKRPPIKCLSLASCFKQQFLTFFTVASLLLAVIALILGSLRSPHLIKWSSLTILVAVIIVSAIKASIHYFLSNKFKSFSLLKSKNNLYQVTRNGYLMQIEQSQIVVGDIVELGYKQRAPTTGILLSPGQIFVKEDKAQDSTQLKLNLENCLKRIQNMSDFDLKVSFQQCNLPSPIILRGSQLLKGSMYSILVLSVTEEQLLEKHRFNLDNKFSSTTIDSWVTCLKSNWTSWAIFLGSFALIFFFLEQILEIKIAQKNTELKEYLIFQFLLKLCTLLIVMSPTFLLTLISSIFLKLMTQLKIIENFQSFFTVKRMLINQKSIVDSEQVSAVQLVIGQKPDLISIKEMENINDSLLKLINQAVQIFKIKLPDSFVQLQPKKQKYRRYIQAYKNQVKIISIFSQPNLATPSFSYPKQKPKLAKISDNSQIKHSNVDIQSDQHALKNIWNNKNLLRLENKFQDRQNKQNLKDIISSKSRIKSKVILDGLIGLAENGLKNYYYFVFDENSLMKITHINVQGHVRLINNDDRQRMTTLSKKIQKVYNITPIILAYGMGPFSKQSNKILLCILGAKIETNHSLFQQLKYLSEIQIKSLAFICESEETGSESEQKIQAQYVSRGFLNKQNNDKIVKYDHINKIIGRFVCKQCLISNCNCKQKIEEASNIQAFLKISENVKIVYNIRQEDVKYLESLYRQVYQNIILVNSTTVPLVDHVSSILTCHQFIKKLRRSLLAFYSISICYFFTAFISWIRVTHAISPTQITLSFFLLSSFCFLTCLADIEFKKSNEFVQQNGKVKIIHKESAVKLISTCFVIILLCQMFQIFHYLLPEYVDNYNQVIEKQGLDILSCKYGPNYSMTKNFKVLECSSHELGFQYSRLSTFITTYLYSSLWLYFVSIHKNYRSPISIISYALSLFSYIIFIEKLPWLMQTYSFGLHPYQYAIALTASLITIVIGHLITSLLSKISVVDSFLSQLEDSISFRSEQKQEIGRLRQYQKIKKWQGQSNHQVLRYS